MIQINKEDKKYPNQLKRIKRPPERLFMKGNVELLNEPGIAIIGSRKCTKYGKKIATEFSEELSRYGFTIISGLAEGIDSYAHQGALNITGKTIAVLPSGTENVYPKENIELYQQIIKNGGLIITEYSAEVEADCKKFLERNRIVSGLALGTLVVEGGYRSGTSVTAKMTIEQEKCVFCIPSNLDSIKGVTPNLLIKKGAKLVTVVEDIVNEYKYLNLTKQKIVKRNIDVCDVNSEYIEIYNLLEKDKGIHVNDIAKILNLDISEVNYKLMMLELEDKIVALPGSNYKKK